MKLAARRIAFGKVLNAGQTCVEPDYLLIEKSVKPAFIEAYRQALHEFFPDGSMDEMPVIVSEKHFARVTALLEGQTAVVGGEFDEKTRFVAPTLLDGVSPDSPVMQEEIFGPILPMLEFSRLDEAIDFIRSRESRWLCTCSHPIRPPSAACWTPAPSAAAASTTRSSILLLHTCLSAA